MAVLQCQRLPDESQEEEFADEDLEALQSQDSIQAIRQEVHEDIESPKHLIEVGEQTFVHFRMLESSVR